MPNLLWVPRHTLILPTLTKSNRSCTLLPPNPTHLRCNQSRLEKGMDKNVREDTPMVNRTIMEIRGATTQGGNYMRITKRCHRRWKIRTPKLRRDRAPEIEIMREEEEMRSRYLQKWQGYLSCVAPLLFNFSISSCFFLPFLLWVMWVGLDLLASDTSWEFLTLETKKIGYALGLNP